MQHLGLAFTVAALLVNVWGLALLAGFFWRDRWFALATGPWLWTTLMFGIECHHGLGNLQSLGAASTVLSIALIVFCQSPWEPSRWTPSWLESLRAWRLEFGWSRGRACLGVFVGVFAYAFSWRFMYPDLHIWVEKVPDFTFIASYYAGTTIPVPDVWLDPFSSTHYYSFQHYAAALMGRLLGMRPGLAYNLGFCLMIALVMTALTGAVVKLTRRAGARWVIAAGFLVGGTGVTLIAPFVLKDYHPWDGVFLFGKVTMDKAPLGSALQAYADEFKRLSLPSEPLAYSIYLGDYHAPLSSYALLGIGVMGALLWQGMKRVRYAAVVGATLTWTVLANVWALPLQVFAIAAWLWTQRTDWRRVTPAVLVGAAVVWISAWTYLSIFTSISGRQDLSFRLVPPDEHTPPLLFLITLLPTLALLGAGLISGNRTCRNLAWLWLGCLLFTEMVFVDDSYANVDNRFNSTLKWWPWVTSAAFLTLGPVLLESAKSRWARGLAWVACLTPCVYGWTLAGFWWNGDKASQGQMEGHYFLTRDPMTRMIFDRLKVERPGVVIENPWDNESVSMASLCLHAGHRLWLGWDGYELLWRGFPESIRPRQAKLVAFFKAEMSDPLTWLESERIDYILWYRSAETLSQWESLDKAVAARYRWCEIFSANERKIGFWRSTRFSSAITVSHRNQHESK